MTLANAVLMGKNLRGTPPPLLRAVSCLRIRLVQTNPRNLAGTARWMLKKDFMLLLARTQTNDLNRVVWPLMAGQKSVQQRGH